MRRWVKVKHGAKEAPEEKTMAEKTMAELQAELAALKAANAEMTAKLAVKAKKEKAEGPFIVREESFIPEKGDGKPVNLLAVRREDEEASTPWTPGFSAGPAKWSAIAEAMENGSLTLARVREWLKANPVKVKAPKAK